MQDVPYLEEVVCAVLCGLICPIEVGDGDHGPAPCLQEFLAGQHFSQGLLGVGCEMVRAVHFDANPLDCIVPAKKTRHGYEIKRDLLMEEWGPSWLAFRIR